MYFPNFIFLRKRLKSSHTSLKKLEKEDFNSINRYFISSLTTVLPPICNPSDDIMHPV